MLTGSVADIVNAGTLEESFGDIDPMSGLLDPVRAGRLAFGGMKGARPPDELDIDDTAEATSEGGVCVANPRQAASQSRTHIVASPLKFDKHFSSTVENTYLPSCCQIQNLQASPYFSIVHLVTFGLPPSIHESENDLSVNIGIQGKQTFLIPVKNGFR